jgi:hypothetical protein
MKDLRPDSVEHSIRVRVANQAPSGAFLATPVMPNDYSRTSKAPPRISIFPFASRSCSKLPSANCR